ncbi:hypothetical protein [Anaerococcus kampingiae]
MKGYKMRKVTTYQLIEGIKRNLLLLIIPPILFFGLVLGLGLHKNGGTYEASAVLIAAAEDGEEVSYNKLVLNEKLANIYMEILKSPDLYQKVDDALEVGGSDLTYSDVMARADYEVNPQAGLISFTYRDQDKKRAADSLKSICENFKLMAKDYLNADNFAYLHDVLVNKASKTKTYIFSVAAGLAGLFLGLIIIIIKTLMSDRIASLDDLAELSYPVLGKSDELTKIKAKLAYKYKNGVIGLASLGKDTNGFAENLARELAKNKKVLFVASEDKKIEDFFAYKYLGENPSQSMDTDDFAKDIARYKEEYDYVIIDEKDEKEAFLAAGIEDMKIILVNNKTRKADLDKLIRDLKDLGLSEFGVVYYQ